MLLLVKCGKCKYRRIKQGEAYCVLYQAPCRLVYGYCRKGMGDEGLSIKRVGKIEKI